MLKVTFAQLLPAVDFFPVFLFWPRELEEILLVVLIISYSSHMKKIIHFLKKYSQELDFLGAHMKVVVILVARTHPLLSGARDEGKKILGVCKK